MLTAEGWIDGDGVACLVKSMGDLHISECGKGRGGDGGPVRGERCVGCQPGRQVHLPSVRGQSALSTHGPEVVRAPRLYGCCISEVWEGCGVEVTLEAALAFWGYFAAAGLGCFLRLAPAADMCEL